MYMCKSEIFRNLYSGCGFQTLLKNDSRSSFVKERTELLLKKFPMS